MRTTSNEERQLWDQWIAQPTAEHRNQLMEHYIPLLGHFARKKWEKLPIDVRSSITTDDLLAEAAIALTKSIEDFDRSRDVLFTTYMSQRMHGAMCDYLREIDWVPRLVRARNEPVKLMFSLDSKPKDHATERAFTHTELGVLLGIEDTLEAIDYIESLIRTLDRLGKLTVVCLYYLGLNMKQTGAFLGVSESRISQVHGMSMTHLKLVHHNREQREAKHEQSRRG